MPAHRYNRPLSEHRASLSSFSAIPFSARCICSVSVLRSLPLKIPFVSVSCCFSFGSTVSCKCRISFALFCAFIISFYIVRNSAISISRTGFGGISCLRIRFCRKSFALLTILRNSPGSQPLLLIDWPVFLCILKSLLRRYPIITPYPLSCSIPVLRHCRL